MNIEGVNLVSMSPAKKPIEGDAALALPENGTTPEDFANALRGQKKLLSEANGQAELLGQLQDMSVPQIVDSSHDSGDLQKSTDAQNELVALLEKYLPVSNTGYKENGIPDIEATLLALTDGLKAIAPGITEDVTATQDMSSAMALNGLTFVKPIPEDAKLNTSGENVASEVSLQKATALRQSIQDGQGFNLQSLENAEPPKQALTLEKQASLLGLEKAVPEVATELPPVYRPIDNRTDGPAIPKPLTHPGWSKDLGEQIIWMNNKELATAEIKLNPVHLGPISVRIDVNQEHQATIMFTAQHAETKEAIEASIPKLREMLATQQLNLVNVNISQNSSPDHGRPQPQPFQKTPENHEQNVESINDTIEKSELGQVVVSKGLLSIYA
jgi:flagellar hook-length control protein FliK